MPKGLARVAEFAQQMRRPDRMTAFLEQGLLAGIRMAALLVFARIMPTELFGTFALVVSISFIQNNLHRSVIILPFIISCQNVDRVGQAIREWWWITVAAAALTALVLLLAWGGAVMIGAPDWVMTSLLFSAISAPPLMLNIFLRRMGYQTEDHGNILVMVLVYVLVYAVGIALALFLRDVQSLPFLAFAAAPAAGSLIGLVRVRKQLGTPPGGMFHSIRGSLHFTKWSFLSVMVASVYANGMNIIIAAFLGAVGSAMFAATRTIVAPIISLTAATDMIDKPQAGRAYAADGIPGLRRSVRSTLLVLVFLGGPYLLFVAIFSGSILEFVYGTKYAGLEVELRMWALAMLLNMIANPLATHLTTLKETKSIFRANLAGALVALAVAIPLLDSFGVVVALVGMSSGRLTSVVLLYLATRRDAPKNLPLATAGAKDTVSDD